MTIQFRRGTASNISAANPTPAAGQPIFETDTGYLKVGDGYTAYNDLNYVHEATTGIPPGGDGGQVLTKTDGYDYSVAWADPGVGVGSLVYTVTLSSDYSTTGTSQTDVPGLSFTPQPNRNYIFRFHGYVQSENANTGVRPGFRLPTVEKVAGVNYMPNSATGSGERWYSTTQANSFVAGSSVANANVNWYTYGEIFIRSGPSPSGTLQITLAGEQNDGYYVRMMAGSVLRVETINEGIDLGYISSIFDGYVPESSTRLLPEESGEDGYLLTIVNGVPSWKSSIELNILDGYLNGSAIQRDFYISVDGYDTNLGTQSSPYRQPQRAINEIVANLFPSGSEFNIYCGSGTFEMPDTAMVPKNITVRIIASLENPVIDGYSTAPWPHAEDGYASLWTIITNGYSGTVGQASHWIYNNTNYTSTVVYPSDSPELRIVSDGYVIFPVHVSAPAFSLFEYETIFTCSSSLQKFIGHSNNFYTPSFNFTPISNVHFYGVHFECDPDIVFEFNGLKMLGCKITNNSVTGRVILDHCYANIITIITGGARLFAVNKSAISGIFYNGIRLSDSHLQSAVCHGGITLVDNTILLGYNNLHGFDLRGTGMSYLTGSTFQISNSTAQSLNTYLGYSSLIESHGFTFSILSSRTVTGSVVNGFSILDGVFNNLEATCNGTLICSGDEVSFGGGVSTSTFAGLPATDAGDTVPYFGRAW